MEKHQSTAKIPKFSEFWTVADLPVELQQFGIKYGVQAVIDLFNIYSKTTFYFKKSYCKEVEKKYVRTFINAPIRFLAKELGKSDAAIYQLIREIKMEENGKTNIMKGVVKLSQPRS